MSTGSRYWSILMVAALTPLLLWAAIPILPTFDDWTSLIAPSFEPLLSKERFLFYGYHWRPFDSVFGYVVGLDPQRLFPLLNHVCVVLGHVACTLTVFWLASILRLSQTARNVATAFFFVTPGMLATVLAVDGLNQTYALLWGMLALVAYLQCSGARKYVGWIGLVMVATLCKENGLMWAVIAPIVAYGFNRSDFRQLRRDMAVGLALMAVYAALILLLPSDITIHPEYVPSPAKTVRGVLKFLLTTWVCVDFVSLLHQPSRNWLWVGVTLLLSLPFSYFIFIRRAALFRQRRLVCLSLGLLAAVAPHLATVFSMMHTYAGLGLAALMVGCVVDSYSRVRPLMAAFALFLASALLVDVHLWQRSVESGLVGREMAQSAIRQTGHPVRSVAIIIIEDSYPKLSSFCVIPSDAFGWGRSVQLETNYRWPTEFTDTTISRTPAAQAQAAEMARQRVQSGQADCAWIVDGKAIKVIQ